MIMRIWHGTTMAEKSDAFFDFVMKTGVEFYEFLLISLWKGSDSIRRFAGPDIDRAIYKFPEDREYWIEMEPGVTHSEILSGFVVGAGSELIE